MWIEFLTPSFSLGQAWLSGVWGASQRVDVSLLFEENKERLYLK